MLDQTARLLSTLAGVACFSQCIVMGVWLAADSYLSCRGVMAASALYVDMEGTLATAAAALALATVVVVLVVLAVRYQEHKAEDNNKPLSAVCEASLLVVGLRGEEGRLSIEQWVSQGDVGAPS